MRNDLKGRKITYVIACGFVDQCYFQVTAIFSTNYGILLKKISIYVILDQ